MIVTTKSWRLKKRLLHKYKCVLVLNNRPKRKDSKYFRIINLPTIMLAKPSKILNNYVGIWKLKK